MGAPFGTVEGSAHGGTPLQSVLRVAGEDRFNAVQHDDYLVRFPARALRLQSYIIVGDVGDYSFVHAAGHGLHIDGLSALAQQQIFNML
ncbi:MAG: hypothetical protein QOD75_2400 [Blastocatellia bacterium]|nr:hypothetical protein [Blastocatellia bacterium]